VVSELNEPPIVSLMRPAFALPLFY